jgi:hypothetical protein
LEEDKILLIYEIIYNNVTRQFFGTAEVINAGLVCGYVISKCALPF